MLALESAPSSKAHDPLTFITASFCLTKNIFHFRKDPITYSNNAPDPASILEG